MKRLLLALGSLALLSALAGGWLMLDLLRFRDRPVTPAEAVVLTIAPGSSLGRIAARLEKAGVITDARKFRLLARWQGSGGRIQAGEYLFEGPLAPGGVLQRLVEGDVVRYRLTIPEGWNLAQIADQVGRQEYGDPQAFLALARDPEFAGRLGLEAATLEGYLFPETYTWSGSIGEERLLRIMVEEFRRRFTPELQARAEELDLTPHQLVTLASIIQKEAGHAGEMPVISSVFHNRLRRGIPLQADPTVIYGLDDFDGNLTRRHLQTPTPYNTYRMRGLPPGPIASPGEEALRAAAFPADTDYLYFVARGDGSHVFSTTLAEHNRAVRRFQLRR